MEDERIDEGFQIAVRYRNSGRYFAVAAPSETAFVQTAPVNLIHVYSGL
ncbi:hypothetical protein COLO4_17211 [Corchorus olitorius]|uniref:Uncharacterized protein n=1 Tax=Corchorus olitorius TaxID=93759 RepID=A0A1R3JDP3_9ROSI|nr:hypothetical protein COLO4_17211 [Corchorus olitorius]